MTVSDPAPRANVSSPHVEQHRTPAPRRDLTAVALTEDGRRLVLVSDAGEEFTLAVDAALRAALRGEHRRPAHLETTMDSALRPRDIQARIRAGESPEQVATVAQAPLEKVMAFATPVLAERAHIADRAQRASLRRGVGEGSAGVLADAVAERFRSLGVSPESVEWDSWRREDGRWTVVADYRSGEDVRRAEFVYDAGGRYVLADDDEARWLAGESSSGAAAAQAGRSGPRPLSAVDDDTELPLGEDAIELVAESRTDEDGPRLEVTADADWIAVQATERPVELGSEADEPAETTADETTTDETTTGGTTLEEAAGEPDTDESQPTPRRTSKRGRRASVPSWDEIMFGGGAKD